MSRAMADSFDVVVVGAGSAGAPVAARLSENPRLKVLLLEAGPKDDSIWIHIPIGYAKLFTDARHNWLYATEPEPELGGRSIIAPRGKTLGGSSAINGLLYVRGQRQDFDTWRQMGNAGWSFDDVLPYFRRAEDFCGGADEFHGTGGPLGVSDVPRHPLCEALFDACAAMGIPRTRDFNGASQEGAGYYHTTTRNGRRCSTAVGYLTRAVRARPNLSIETEALATRILLDGRRAVGVAYDQRGVARQARAAEVILCGGAFNSPQLLQLSGIGPGALLQQHGIAVAHDLPGVGENLHDHLQVRTMYRCTEPITLNDILGSRLKQWRAGAQWVLTRKGPLTLAAGHAGVFYRTDPALEAPDAQIHLIAFSTDRIGTGMHPFPGFTASSCQLRPEARGHCRIASPDPKAPPKIFMNYLGTETDRQVQLKALKIMRAIMARPEMRRWIVDPIDPPDTMTDDAELMAYVRAKSTTIYHPCGTCRMGPDSQAVVDARLRVHGIAGLRVADAAIMPVVASGNTNAACIMIGEKCADMVAEDLSAQPARAA
jgi:choline dehydrogenase